MQIYGELSTKYFNKYVNLNLLIIYRNDYLLINLMIVLHF
jgi:hypothetical protein